MSLSAQMIDKDNYQILVDNGTYTEDEIAPDPTIFTPLSYCE